MDNTLDIEQTMTVARAVTIVLVITSVSILFRVWARFRIAKSLEIDDILLLVSWVVLVALCALIAAAEHYGLGHHEDEVEESQLRVYLKLFTAAMVAYSWGTVIVKMSFVTLYLRLFPGRRLQITNKCLLIFLVMQVIEETLVVIFRCSPVQKSWEPTMEGKCLDLHPAWFSTFVINLLTDLVLFIQPIPTMWRLDLPIVKRLGLVVMMSLGLLVTAISIIRIQYVASFFDNADDFDTYAVAEPLIWSAVEIGALIICSNIPSIRKVIQAIPNVRTAFGSSFLKKTQRTYHERPVGTELSFAMTTQKQRGYLQSKKGGVERNHRSRHTFGTTTQASTTRRDSYTRSDEDLFPYGSDQIGGITVTNEVIQDVEHTFDITIVDRHILPPALSPSGSSFRHSIESHDDVSPALQPEGRRWWQ